jgi:hypothetical protein
LSLITQIQKGSTALIKAVATALVLIAGAAVVLWYGNTLNSWVLGGLIGGLAALLLSIPISLTLFTYLARQHEERERNERRVLEEGTTDATRDKNGRLESAYLYHEAYAPRSVYVEEDEDFFDHRKERGGEVDTVRYLPAPPVRRLPAPSTPSSVNNNPPPTRQTPVTRRLSRELSERDASRATRRLSGRPMTNSGQQTGMTRSQFQSQALHMARMETVRPPEEEYEIETPSPYEPHKPYLRRTRRIVDSSPPPNSPYQASTNSGQSSGEKTRHYDDPETDAIDIGLSTGSLKNPLLRRAPYLYDDDELKSKLEQQIDTPITRRTSRKLPRPLDD